MVDGIQRIDDDGGDPSAERNRHESVKMYESGLVTVLLHLEPLTHLVAYLQPASNARRR
jgi:hypothetical protein